ncbi:MAG: DUF262 domain-containing protein [Saprospiraceae bacterium]|nr:DUF262 domain-containing protein [Saprospiraceae bacterium]
MESTTSSKDLKLNGVIEQIYQGDYQLPEFQRDYIWKDSNIKALFESVLLGHPIGSILLLELNKENPLLAWVNFNEIIPPENRQFNYINADKAPPRYLVLDGQQRLTSLSHLTNGTSEKVWYINLRIIKDSWEKFNCPDTEKELKEWIELGLDISMALTKNNKSDDTLRELRGKKKKMPLTLLGEKTRFTTVINEIRDQINETVTEKNYEIKNHSKLKIKKDKTELEAIVSESSSWLKFLGTPLFRLFDNYFNYNMPSVIVSEKMGITGVCKVFTKINTSGIELGAFDLLVAVMYPKEIRVKQMFDEVMDQYPLVKVLDESPKRYLLQTIALLAGISPKTASLPELIKPVHISNLWTRAADLLEEACKQIDLNCGAALERGSDKYLVYSPLVASLACILNDFPIDIKDSNLSRLRKQKLKAWYYGAGVSDRYSDGTDVKQIQDIKEMNLWFSSATYDDNIPNWLKELWSDFNSSKNSSLGKAVISLINFKEPKDFYEDKPCGPSSTIPCDLHHIFPRAALRDQIMTVRGIRDKEKAEKIIKQELFVDSILNQTWIYSDTNRKVISDQLPSKYLEQIIREYGGNQSGKRKLIEIMHSHCINEKAVEALLRDDYNTFIYERRNSIINEFKITGFVKNIIDNKPLEDEGDS